MAVVIGTNPRTPMLLTNKRKTMCLFSKSELKTATEDIVCFKMLRRLEDNANDVCFVTPFRMEVVTKRHLQGKLCFTAKGKKSIKQMKSPIYDGAFSYGRGFIHTYVHENAAMDECHFECDFVFMCVIPKGTKYAEGRDTYGNKSFVSRKVRFVDTNPDILTGLTK